ncbi:MAG TPA: EAL domain-containing protein [Microthrixaceae bacterium]|nr:EAL domain-containing protein [Microthrixaceae bacterium]
MIGLLAAAAGALWPELSPLLRSLGVAHPTQVVRVLGSLVLLGGATAVSVEAVRSRGRRRIGLGLVAAGAGILAAGTLAVQTSHQSAAAIITTAGPTTLQILGIAAMVAGVIALPSNLDWSWIAVIDVGLAATAALSALWLAPVRGGSGPEGGLLDVTRREPTAIVLVALMVVGVALVVRVVQDRRPGDLALATAVLILPSALYTAVVGQKLALTAPSLRSAVMWWLVGPPILVLAGWQMSRARRATPGDARPRVDAAGGASSGDAGIDSNDDERRARRAEWVFVFAMLITLASVATQRLFLDALDPVLLLLGLVAVLGSAGRLALLQREQTDLQQQLGSIAEELRVRARTDELTGLGNRLALVEEVDRVLLSGARDVHAFYIDIDDFKTVNDALGHEVGDQLLVRTAEHLTAAFGPRTFRLGGDEFVALAVDATCADAAERARRAVADATEPVDIGGVAVTARLSIGVSHATVDVDGTPSDSPEELLRMADLALNRAKELGRCRVVTFDTWLQERVDRRLMVQHGLHRAVELDEFDVTYRPEVDLATGEVLGAEALLRWETPDHHLLHPAEYLGIAADSGLVPAISRSGLRRATAPWTSADPPTVPLSINLTRPELLHGGLLDDLEDIAGSIPRSALRLQIPEAAFMEPAAQPTIDQLIGAGYRICVRDFGTASSSVRRLSGLPDPAIRIDRSFVSGLAQRRSDRAVLSTIVEVGLALGVQITADGVTQPGQVAILRELGVTRGQGWLFGRPVPWPDFLRRTDGSSSPSALGWRPPTAPMTTGVVT